ncbi:hypothetical protein BJP27_24110 (plasmid) [Pseudomonas oryzihabitans]|nr:hypothetical protein BJP27_24110 [Pseudomonas psychrotolerans]
MTVSNEAYLQQAFSAQTALGDKIINSDAHLVIDGFEDISAITKQFPWPILTPEGEIEVPGAMGITTLQPQQIKIRHSSPIAFMETTKGHIQDMVRKINEAGGRFNARVYEGTIENPLRTARIVRCFLQLENMDRDFENRAQIGQFTGTLHFHYLGEA